VKADENAIAFDSANASYAKGNYDKAIQLYEKILSGDKVSAEVYFNLGNAYYKSGKIGMAILNYERAKKIHPEDDDILTNLKFAEQKTEDKIDAAPEFFLSQWKGWLSSSLSERSWSWACIISMIISAFLLALYVTSASTFIKKLGFYLGITCLLAGVAIFFIARQSYTSQTELSEGVITSAAVTVNGSPAENGTKLFMLHEGTRVKIMDENAGWTEIQIANGNSGWVKGDLLSKI
jgi:tetratricopeptide (TPR) repeat protein